MRTVFFGTPAIAVPALRALAETTEVVGVVCQPDRPSGRGLHVHAPPVKQAALDLALVVHQPVKVKTGDLHQWLIDKRADLALVLAYGRILPRPVLDAPRLGCLNLHASLLPKLRGAAPIQWAIMNGERETGVSLMQMDDGMDTGPVFIARPLPIDDELTGATLGEQIAELAARMVHEDLPRAARGELVAMPQDPTLVTYAPPLQKEHCRVDFSKPAREVRDLVRALAPSPGAMTTLRGRGIKLLQVRLAEAGVVAVPPGRVAVTRDRRTLVGTGDTPVEIVRAQVEGRKALEARDLINGRAIADGDVLGT